MSPTDPLPLQAIPLPPCSDKLETLQLLGKRLSTIPDVWICFWFNKTSGWLTTIQYSEKSALAIVAEEEHAQVFLIPGRPYAPTNTTPAVPPAPDLQPLPPP